MNNALIVLAGGLGSRTNNDIPKQFIEVDDVPIFINSIQPFLEFVDTIIISCEKSYLDYAFENINKHIKNKKVFVVEGGGTGLESTLNGFSKLLDFNYKFDYVFIHDAARPFLRIKTIVNCMDSLQKYDYVFAGAKMIESVYDEVSKEIKKKDNLYKIVSPHAFKFDFAKEIYKKALGSKELTIFNFMIANGYSVHIAESEDMNFKITTPDQLEFAVKILKNDD